VKASALSSASCISVHQNKGAAELPVEKLHSRT
jgi:hypothetical protein